MKLIALTSLVALSLCAAACSGNDGAIKVDPAQTALTDQGKDSLFTLEIVEARDGGYASDTLKVQVTPDGKDAITVSCSFSDVNTNKKLDVGDKLACTEGAENTLGAAMAGQEAKVELFATIDGSEERVGDATWTPAK